MRSLSNKEILTSVLWLENGYYLKQAIWIDHHTNRFLLIGKKNDPFIYYCQPKENDDYKYTYCGKRIGMIPYKGVENHLKVH